MSKKIFQIAWDCDGVLAESHEPVLKIVNQRLSQILNKKINLIKSDLDNIDTLFEKALALTGDEKIAADIRECWHTPEILRLSPPNPATLEVFKRCQKLPNTAQRVVTTRHSQNGKVTREWLEQYLPDVDWQQNLYIRQGSDLLNGEEYKIIQLAHINCMLEDNPITVTNIHQRLPQCHVIYLNQPWNSRDLDSYRSQFRVNFDDTESVFQHILKLREKFFSE